MIGYFPKYFSSKAISLYLLVLVACNLLFISHLLPLVWLLFGLIEAIGFFYFTNKLTYKWQNIAPKLFTQRLFIMALIIRLIWVIFSYFFFYEMTGHPFEFSAADSTGYHNEAKWLADMIHNGDLQPFYKYIKGNYSDMGYPYYLGWQYWITGNSILIARIIKALLGAFMCMLIYKLAARNFGESVGRMSAIFCMLMPNLIYYTGLHTKETEMVFLTVWFIERADFLIRSKQYKIFNIAIPIIMGVSLFFFRTILGVTTLFALFSSILFSSSVTLTLNKRVIILVWGLAVAGYLAGGKIATEVETTWNSKDSNQQKTLDFITKRQGGNTFAKYASQSFFIPAIFIIPLPTVINVPVQENQMMINGGNYVKNFLAFFIFFSFYWIIKNKKWRNITLIGSFTLSYLSVVALSGFAQAERFHQPVLPFLMIFAAFGLTKFTKAQKGYFTWYMVFIFAAIVGWSWFKLAGRGLI
jgi:hypothetical protein